MPYYGMTDPADYYQQGGGFDPLTGRLQGGNLIMQFLTNMQRQRDEKQQREWAGEDRELGKHYKEAQIGEMGRAEREVETPAQREKREADARKEAHRYKMKEIREQGYQTRATQSVKPPTKTPTELRDDYLSDMEKIDIDYGTSRVKLFSDKAKSLDNLNSNVIFFANQPGGVLAARKEIEDSFQQAIKELEAVKEARTNSVHERYSSLGLPWAKKPKKPAQAPPLAGGGASSMPGVAGTKKKSEIPAGADTRIGQDGNTYVEIGGKIYLVI